MQAIIDLLQEAERQGYDLELFCEESLYNASAMDIVMVGINLGIEYDDETAYALSEVCQSDEQWDYLDIVRAA